MGGTEEFDCILNVRRCRVYTVILYTLFYPARCDDASSTQTRQSVDAQDSNGGRGNTASQRTCGEHAPIHAVGKVPVPLGRECQWETTKSWPSCCSDASGGAAQTGLGFLPQHSHAVSARER